MNKVEFIGMVAEKTGKTKVEVTPIVESVFACLMDRMYQEDPVKIAGFGEFGIKKRAARTGRNPQTGEAVEIGAKNACYFKPAKALKEYVQD
jgi:DNA-binding protein HU-beta